LIPEDTGHHAAMHKRVLHSVPQAPNYHSVDRTKVLPTVIQAPKRRDFSNWRSSDCVSTMQHAFGVWARCASGGVIPDPRQACRSGQPSSSDLPSEDLNVPLAWSLPGSTSGVIPRGEKGKEILPFVLVAHLDLQDLALHCKERIDRGGVEVRAPPFSDDRERAIE